MTTILLIVLLVLLFAGLPAWNYHPYGWYPSSGAGVVLVVLLILILLGRI